MARIAKNGFWLLLDNGARVRYEKGEEIAAPHASHWYVLENSHEIGAAQSAPASSALAPVAAPVAATAPVAEVEAPAVEETAEEMTEHQALLEKAKAIGMKIDARWGLARLRSEVQAAEKAQ